jgi:hypothetical protein
VTDTDPELPPVYGEELRDSLAHDLDPVAGRRRWPWVVLAVVIVAAVVISAVAVVMTR